ncbi:MAG: 5-methyltetrahydropteroyltriglutamate--homocysteine methyltransferase [bacterium]
MDERPDPAERHAFTPDARFDGGNMDCGNGLLLHIRKNLDPLPRGRLLEILSTECSVDEDLPAWCRLTGNSLVSWTRAGEQRSFLIAKGEFTPAEAMAANAGAAPAARGASPSGPAPSSRSERPALRVEGPAPSRPLPSPSPAPAVAALSVMGIGSWPRPRWMLQAMHEHLEGRMSDEEFQATADDAVRLAVAAQLAAGVDVITDGEQRRDSYANFVGGRLDQCQLIPLVDLLSLVDDPEHLQKEFKALDVPAADVRHPALSGPLRRTRPLVGHELAFAKTLTDRPVKVALPGPYLLSRILWLECVSDRAYDSREALAEDIVRALREEVFDLLASGAALVQLDEPVLSEVVFGSPKARRSFMCGALSERKAAPDELAFAVDLINRVVAGAPRERVALHVCRGNWTPDESAALTGDYRPLVATLAQMNVGTYFLELCTPRAGEMEVLRDLPGDRRIGVGVVNQKQPRVETAEEILERARRAIQLFGRERVLLNPDCGFATFADNPVATAQIAQQKLAAMVEAARRLRQEG